LKAAAPGSLSLIDSRFFSALEAEPGTYPGDQLGGETMDGFRNMLALRQEMQGGAAPQALEKYFDASYYRGAMARLSLKR